jgi:hypothetical protein
MIDPGIPGEERIVFRPTEPLNMAQCGLLLGWKDTTGMIIPLPNCFYWFGDYIVTPPCWIVVYTGQGKFNIGDFNGQPVYVHYWGMDHTLFNYSEQIPLLIKFSGVQVGESLKLLPSYVETQKQLIQPAK